MIRSAGRISLAAGAVCILIQGSAIAQDAPTTQQLREAAIRTPAAPQTPRINGARVFGAGPGHPFMFHVPATGQKPIHFEAKDLPAGLAIDAATGIITGTTPSAGTYPVNITATNAAGNDSYVLKIVAGDTLCLTPQMGWNSWNFYAGNIDKTKIGAAADAMVSTGLIDHGWTFINMDDRWEAPQRDPDGKIEADPNKFGDLKPLADSIHARGLKFGIYSSPGPRTCAGAVATYQHEDQDAMQYANWGVDYVKYDWCSYGTIATQITGQKYAELLPGDDGTTLAALLKEQAAFPRRARNVRPTTRQTEVTNQIRDLEAKLDPAKKQQVDLAILQAPYEQFHQSLLKTNRDIVYSLCQYGNGDVWKWGDQVGGNSWRTTGDINASYNSISSIGFKQGDIASYAKPGHWNDPDMLEVGNGRLTPDENYTHMTLWCMLAAPLLIGCEMPKMDAFTLSLFTNDQVLAVDQDELGKEGYRLKADGTNEVWVKPLAGGDWAVAFFNRGTAKADISVNWADLKLPGAPKVTDLWRQKPVDVSGTGALTMSVAGHGAEMFRIKP